MIFNSSYLSFWLASTAPVLGPTVFASALWLWTKRLAAAWDSPALWDWSNIGCGVVGAILASLFMYPLMPDSIAVGVNTFYRAASLAIWLMVGFFVVSGWIEEESQCWTPDEMRPFGERLREGYHD